MKVYARILESSGSAIENFSTVVTRDIDGRPTTTGCWTHPDYRAFWAAVAEDLFRNYDLDGLQWGAERMGPLMNVVLPWNDRAPTCFCEHCRARGRTHGIDDERARKGYRGAVRLRPRPDGRQPAPRRWSVHGLRSYSAALSGDSGVGVSVPVVARRGDAGHVRGGQGA